MSFYNSNERRWLYAQNMAIQIHTFCNREASVNYVGFSIVKSRYGPHGETYILEITRDQCFEGIAVDQLSLQGINTKWSLDKRIDFPSYEWHKQKFSSNRDKVYDRTMLDEVEGRYLWNHLIRKGFTKSNVKKE